MADVVLIHGTTQSAAGFWRLTDQACQCTGSGGDRRGDRGV